MSKSGALAGLRVGYALGDAGLIEALRRVKDSFNSYPLGRIAQAGATASACDETYFRESCAKVIIGREAMTRELTRLGFLVLPSNANFVFARHPAWSASSASRQAAHRALSAHHGRDRGRHPKADRGGGGHPEGLVASPRVELSNFDPKSDEFAIGCWPRAIKWGRDQICGR